MITPKRDLTRTVKYSIIGWLLLLCMPVQAFDVDKILEEHTQLSDEMHVLLEEQNRHLELEEQKLLSNISTYQPNADNPAITSKAIALVEKVIRARRRALAEAAADAQPACIEAIEKYRNTSLRGLQQALAEFTSNAELRRAGGISYLAAAQPPEATDFAGGPLFVCSPAYNDLKLLQSQ